MLRLLTDENFDGRIVRGLRDREPELDLLRAEDVKLRRTPDPRVLEWAAVQDRIVVTHDIRTMPGHAYERVRLGEKMPGLIHVPDWFPIGQAIDEVLLVAVAMSSTEIDRRVIHIPLK